ncbi:hypothetical protein JOF56_006040 [Kibdelosporangium banguiense]|uniref:DUF4878 domain-containing protein n=1 Tax=Kibdelosporangium banguiense TaxID=1365924 RepID=A0ABS4TNV9_9PSEU|nr:hypothetical protein [Kibdelosporangium banguiense]MBP2325655.1 hypothetical protein [Kibdelosporangium banguiense]
MSTKDTRRRNGLILVTVAVVLVLVVAGVGVFLLSGNGSTDDPAEAAQEFTSLYQRGLNSSGRDVDVADFEPVVCAAVMPSMREAFSAKENPVEGAPQFKLSVKDVRTEGDKGSFTVISEITVPASEKQTTDEPFTLVLENGGWRVCGIS